MNNPVPKRKDLINPTLAAIRTLGGSASVGEIDNQVIEFLFLSSDIIDIPHGDGSKSELHYRLAWARTDLKRFGLIDNSERGVWSLTSAGQNTATVDPDEVIRAGSKRAKNRIELETQTDEEDLEGGTYDSASWREDLLKVLQNIAPDAFERLCQRLLRESGFIEVEVTGRSGDGGIDGHGIIRLAGLISFPVLFQCKRHRNSVGASVVRDFRGAMIGRSEKGVILTTGTFTRDAQKEATRDGAPPIRLDRRGIVDRQNKGNQTRSECTPGRRGYSGL